MPVARTLARVLPFLRWFPIGGRALRLDLIAGVTGALVLVPKAMAYAQLAGLPVQYGLYAAFVPAVVAALWGSSRQLLTGPVAVVSLMTASALAPLAVAGSDHYVALALLLALLVGLIQLGMGLFKLGAIVNFVSHPVIIGFINAAAIIICLSQLNKLLRLPLGRSDSFLVDVREMLGQIGDTHLPTVAMGGLAFVIMLAMKRFTPEAIGRTSVLVAVVVTTVLSARVGFEHNHVARTDQVTSPTIRELLDGHARTTQRIGQLNADIARKSAQLRELRKTSGDVAQRVLAREYEISLLRLEARNADRENAERLQDIRAVGFEYVPGAGNGAGALYLTGQVPPTMKTDGHHYHIKAVSGAELTLAGGGEVVGAIPGGLPSPTLPQLSWDAVAQLASAAFVIALVAFMESISMAKALATQSRQRVDANQELIGQGLANVGGSFFQSYPVTGSFSGSAINLQAGAQTGLASVSNGVFVGVTLLLLTPWLHHLPQAVLSAIIIVAVAGLIQFGAIRRAWRASRTDGIVAVTSFVLTLAFAPHLDRGILAGAGLALVLYLYRTMKPRVAMLSRHPDGTLRDAAVYGLETCRDIAVVRFDGQLYFANTSYFEDSIQERLALRPGTRYLIVVGDGINNIDATGEEMLMHLHERLRRAGITVLFTGLKKQVLEVLERTQLLAQIGDSHVFRTEDQALEFAWRELGGDHAASCPLNVARPIASSGSRTG